MNRVPSLVKALAGLILLLVVLGTGYVYLNNRALKSEPASTELVKVATSTSMIINHIIADNLMLGQGAQVIEANLYNGNVVGTGAVYTLAYRTVSSVDQLRSLYRNTLPSRGYAIYTERPGANGTEFTATTSTSSLTVTIMKGATSTPQKVIIILSQ